MMSRIDNPESLGALSMHIRTVATTGLLAACGVVAAVLVTAQTPVGQQQVLPDTTAIPPAMIDAGRKIFHGRGTCFACHGMNLEGGPIAPTLKEHSWKDAKNGDLGAIYHVVTHGVKGTAMVSHPGGIADADAVNVAAYVWSVGHRGTKP
jgi:mono/diheme cytochrome c family protein